MSRHEGDERRGRGRGRGRRGGLGRGSLLEPALLASLAGGASHGYGLRGAIEELTSGFVVADPGGIYRVLQRLEEEGLVVSDWAEGDFGPQRRQYRLTSSGRDVLSEWGVHLKSYEETIKDLIRAIDEAVEKDHVPSTENKSVEDTDGERNKDA